MSVQNFLQFIKNIIPNSNLPLLAKTFEFSIKINRTAKKIPNNFYIRDLIATALFWGKARKEQTIVAAGILYEAIKKKPLTERNLKKLKQEFNEEIHKSVINFAKFGTNKNHLPYNCSLADKDINLILFNMIECLNSLKNIHKKSKESIYSSASNALKIYSPLSNRLGMHNIKNELEFYSFKYLYPKEFKKINSMVLNKYKNSNRLMAKIKNKLEREILKENIKNFKIKGRTKNLYRIYRKLLTHNSDILAIHDIIALRIIAESIPDCYSILNIIHKLCPPVNGRIKNYITIPKQNGYQSLHTTASCMGEIIEFQIRTKKMDKEAEFGAAAHWYYSENGSHKKNHKINFELLRS